MQLKNLNLRDMYMKLDMLKPGKLHLNLHMDNLLVDLMGKGENLSQIRC